MTFKATIRWTHPRTLALEREVTINAENYAELRNHMVGIAGTFLTYAESYGTASAVISVGKVEKRAVILTRDQWRTVLKAQSIYKDWQEVVDAIQKQLGKDFIRD